MVGLSVPLCLGAFALAAAQEDTSALVQASVQSHRGNYFVTARDAIVEDPEGPVAYTKLGKIIGARKDGYNLFAGLPYAERPERFEEPKPKQPWAPEVLNATKFRQVCVGGQVGEKESEDCLFMQAWVPQGGIKNMPVVVYFHGGINQHGGGFEGFRRGDYAVQNKKYPTIFINFDWRLGLFGWFDLEGSNVTRNLGFLDQQAMLRFVHEHISAFGGDPNRVTLEGQSEGCGIILTHMTSPGSKGLFHRVAFHSPVADIWSRHVDGDRTKFMIEQAGCKRKELWSTMRCLKRKTARHLWYQDWVSESLSRNVGSPTFMSALSHLLKYYVESPHKNETAGMLGYHPIPDGGNIPGEARDLIREGKFHKVPMLITVSPNETFGIVPEGAMFAMKLITRLTTNKTNIEAVREEYNNSLLATGVRLDELSLANQIVTDKVFTCDARSLANEMTRHGSKVHVGMFWKRPKYDPVGKSTSRVCVEGATCHAAEMFYVLPQGKPIGLHWQKGMEADAEFADRYHTSFLAFVNGDEHPWAPWDDTHPMTFYDENGPRVVPHYREEQCKALAKSDNGFLPRVNTHTPESIALGHI